MQIVSLPKEIEEAHKEVINLMIFSSNIVEEASSYAVSKSARNVLSFGEYLVRRGINQNDVGDLIKNPTAFWLILELGTKPNGIENFFYNSLNESLVFFQNLRAERKKIKSMQDKDIEDEDLEGMSRGEIIGSVIPVYDNKEDAFIGRAYIYSVYHYCLYHLKDKKWKKLVTPNKSLTNEMLTSKYNSISIEKMGALYDETDTSMFLSIDTFHKKMKKNHPRALYKMLVELTK